MCQQFYLAKTLFHGLPSIGPLQLYIVRKASHKLTMPVVKLASNPECWKNDHFVGETRSLVSYTLCNYLFHRWSCCLYVPIFLYILYFSAQEWLYVCTIFNGWIEHKYSRNLRDWDLRACLNITYREDPRTYFKLNMLQ